MIRRGSLAGWVYLTALICLFSVTFWGVIVAERNAKHERRRAASNERKLSSASLGPDAADSHSGTLTGSRTLFPYSVIPGGVESAQDLRNALKHDPIAAAHYSDFDLNQTRVVRLASDEKVYVSYRLNNHIYWTNKKLTLLKGETIITDGKNAARTRCGNRLSDTAQAPVAAKQPLDMTLDPAPLPDLASARPIMLPMALPFPVASSVLASSSGDDMVPPPAFPPVGGGSPHHHAITPPITLPPTPTTPATPNTPTPPNTPPTTPPIATPEPDNLILTVAGVYIVLASGWFGYFRRRIHA